MRRHPNAILARLDADVVARLDRGSEVCNLPVGRVLVEANGSIQHIYFPHSGIISSVVEVANEQAVEAGIIGNDGVFGGGVALDHQMSMNRVRIQIAGTFTVVASSHVVAIASDYPEFRRALMSYEQFFLAQVQQTAACNAVHSVKARTYRWLLRMCDLVGPDLVLKQEILAEMLGVRRTSVTKVMSELQGAGHIAYARGSLHVINIEAIRLLACGCDRRVVAQYDRLFPVLEANSARNLPTDQTSRGKSGVVPAMLRTR